MRELCDAPRLGAAPNVTNAFVPPNSSALFAGSGVDRDRHGVAGAQEAVARRQPQDVGALHRERRRRRRRGRRWRTSPSRARSPCSTPSSAIPPAPVVGRRARRATHVGRERDRLIRAGIHRRRLIDDAVDDDRARRRWPTARRRRPSVAGRRCRAP